MAKNNLSDLLKRYADGTCTDEERRLVERLYEENTNEALSKEPDGFQKQEMFNNILQNIQEQEVYREPKRSHIYKWAAAAGVVLAIGAGLWFWKRNPQPVVAQDSVAFKNDIAPGKNKATLTLADGSIVVLNDSKQGQITKQGAVKIIKLDDGRLAYKAIKGQTTETMLNTIATPAGGQYQVVLPDGTRVWLNSGSSLQFPVQFANSHRDVTLKGEAYFEVAKDKARPFTVDAGEVDVKVLGTHFNVMAYDNEDMVKTTLLEGSVKVTTPHSSGLLKPDHMASVDKHDDGIAITDADAEQQVAWKNNLFWFASADIHQVMRQLARWYDVDVKYEGKITKAFSGTLPRGLSAIKLLTILQQTGGVHFKIDGRIITVMP
ncbi:MAG: FecR domain-containing protein [Mucilaginibacter sp.]|nr:FecR domain-containing protein [Mucilaginibacter sp.]